MNNEAPSYYAIIPANVRYCSELSANEKLLYGEITALCSKTGECWATNKYFADLYGVCERSVKMWISNLVRLGFINSVINKEDGNVRHLKIISLPSEKNFTTPSEKNFTTPSEKNFPHNNINNNNTRVNNTPILRNNTTEGSIITSYYPYDVSPTGDVLGSKRPVGPNDLPRPKKATKAEDYGLVKFDIEDIQENDWERLLNWFEYNHRDHATGNVLRPYCQKMFKQYVNLLKTLSNECWLYAVDCVEAAINKGYQGFGDSTRFYCELKPLEDYEDELKIARGFQAAPESLPEHLSRYKPIVYDMAEKYFTHWIEQMKNNTTKDPERLSFEIKDMEQRLNWVLEQKNTLQSKKS